MHEPESIPIDLSDLLDHIGYAQGLTHLDTRAPVLSDDNWVTRTAAEIVENRWMAIRILTSVLLDRDVDGRTTRGILSIDGPDGLTFTR